MKEINNVQQKLLAAVETSAYQNKTIVFGEGAENPALMMIGEAPGGDEEKQGRPFVGKAGKNLSAFLEVVGLKREEIYISNVVKLRPTKESPKTGKSVNRPPSSDEIAFFLPFLLEEIQVIAPKVVVTLGNVPLKAVTGEKKAVITLTEGKYHQIKLMLSKVGNQVTYLKRISFAEIALDDRLDEGKWRYLSEDEIKTLTQNFNLLKTPTD